ADLDRDLAGDAGAHRRPRVRRLRGTHADRRGATRGRRRGGGRRGRRRGRGHRRRWRRRGRGRRGRRGRRRGGRGRRGRRRGGGRGRGGRLGGGTGGGGFGVALALLLARRFLGDALGDAGLALGDGILDARQRRGLR